MKSNTQTSWFEKQSNAEDSRIITKTNNVQKSRVKTDYSIYSPNVNDDTQAVVNRHGIAGH
jgi:hypothetical protein